jgi:hypothetical protein
VKASQVVNFINEGAAKKPLGTVECVVLIVILAVSERGSRRFNLLAKLGVAIVIRVAHSS